MGEGQMERKTNDNESGRKGKNKEEKKNKGK